MVCCGHALVVFVIIGCMKIGEFAKRIGLSSMTVRYYMDLGLIQPEKKDNFRDFTAACIEDAAWILRYKSCGFSMASILEAFAIRRDSALSSAEKQSALLILYTREKEGVLSEYQVIGECLQKLDNTVATIRSNITNNAESSDIPMELFSIIHCPYCNVPLSWHMVCIVNNAIRSGHGYCSCGYLADIEDGILIVRSRSDIIIKIIDANRETVKKRPVKDVSYVEEFYRWLMGHLSRENLKGKILFEDVINTISFLSRSTDELDPDALYVLCDTDIGVVKYHMQSIRSISPKSKLLMIVDDGVHHPIKKGCIDIALDYCSSEIMQQYGYPSVFPVIRPYVHDDTLVLGRFSYMLKRKHSIDQSTNVVQYQLAPFKQNMREQGLMLTHEKVGTQPVDESIYNECMPGDLMSLYAFVGKWSVKE